MMNKYILLKKKIVDQCDYQTTEQWTERVKEQWKERKKEQSL